MNGEDEIIFTGEYKDFRLGARFDVSGKGPADVASVLGYISANIEPYAFKFSGIDTKKIEDFAKPSARGIAGVYGFLESMSPTAIKDSLAKMVPEPKLLPAAESYLLNRLLDKAGVPFKVQGSASVKPGEEKIEDFIGFIGKYGQWMAVKKLGLEKVQDYEVSGILSGIDFTIVNKAFDFAGIKKDDALVNSIAGGKRKSFGNAVLCLKDLETKMSGSADDTYVVCKVLETIGYRPYASPEMLTEAHPDIKPPKVKGRKPKG